MNVQKAKPLSKSMKASAVYFVAIVVCWSVVYMQTLGYAHNITCPYVCIQGGSQFSKWDHSHPVEEQQEETVAAGAAEGLSGGLVPWGTLG